MTSRVPRQRRCFLNFYCAGLRIIPEADYVTVEPLNSHGYRNKQKVVMCCINSRRQKMLPHFQPGRRMTSQEVSQSYNTALSEGAKSVLYIDAPQDQQKEVIVSGVGQRCFIFHRYRSGGAKNRYLY